MNINSLIGRMRGLDPEKEGVNHWWAQRVTAIVLVPLVLWFVISLLIMARADHAAAVAWIGSPINALLLVMLIFAVFYHGYLGLQVVIEDYIHVESLRHTLLRVIMILSLVLGAAGILAVLLIAFGG